MDKMHEFTLYLSGVNELTQDVVDGLYEAGCDDGQILRCDGKVSIGFSRPAPTMLDAIASAIKDVEKAGVGAKVVHVEPEGPDPNGYASGTNCVLQAIAIIDPQFGRFASELLELRNQFSPTR